MDFKRIKSRSIGSILKTIDDRWGLGALERLVSVHWFNPFATLWLNLRSFPFLQAVKFPVWCYGRPRFYCLSGSMKVEGECKSGMIRFNQVRLGSPNFQSVHSEIYNQGTIIFRGRGVIGTGNIIRVASNAVLDIANNFKIADFINLGCFTTIVIGEQSRIAHRCQIFDSNYHYIANIKKREIPNQRNLITIGKGCWICNSSILMGGVKLPNYTIVASNSLVNKDFSSIEEGSIIGGSPAKYLSTGYRRVENISIDHILHDYYDNGNNSVYIIPNDITPEMISAILTKK